MFLLWFYVPVQASAFAALNAQLPLLTRIAIFASNWFVRLLPFAVVLGILGSGGFLAFGIWMGLTKRRALRWLLVAIGTATTALSAAVVVAMYLGLRNVALHLR